MYNSFKQLLFLIKAPQLRENAHRCFKLHSFYTQDNKAGGDPVNSKVMETKTCSTNTFTNRQNTAGDLNATRVRKKISYWNSPR